MKVAEEYCCMVSITDEEVGDSNPFWLYDVFALE
jgi:hypothetical protein